MKNYTPIVQRICWIGMELIMDEERCAMQQGCAIALLARRS